MLQVEYPIDTDVLSRRGVERFLLLRDDLRVLIEGDLELSFFILYRLLDLASGEEITFTQLQHLSYLLLFCRKIDAF